jgi:hypothetical protein
MKSIRLSLLAASLFLVVSSVSWAQSPPATDTANPQSMRHHGVDRHAKHLAQLKDKLNLSSQQDGAWQSFIQAMQKPEHSARPDRLAFEKMTTPERLEQMQKMRQQRDVLMQKRADGIQLFYAQLSAEQKTVFDAQSLRHMSRMHGGMHAAKMDHAKHH